MVNGARTVAGIPKMQVYYIHHITHNYKRRVHIKGMVEPVPYSSNIVWINYSSLDDKLMHQYKIH